MTVVTPSKARTHRGIGSNLIVCLTAMVLAVVLSLFVLLRPALAEPSSAPDPTLQTDGEVRAVLLVGDRIYLGGDFRNVNGEPRDRLAAIDANTGELTGWAPSASNRVTSLAASPDGSRIYAGGYFIRVNGAERGYLVALDAATGGTVQGWNAQTDAPVYSVAAMGSRVYLGGQFTQLGGLTRPNLAAVNAATGAPDPGWNPGADGNVRSLVPSPDGSRLYAGGHFENVSGQPIRRLAALDPVTGAPDSAWRPNPCYPVYDVKASGTGVYVAGGGTPAGCGAGGWAEAFDAATGSSLWRHSSNGDFQSVALLGGKAYYGGHFTEIPFVAAPAHGERWKRFAAMDAATGVLDPQWKPETNFGVWGMAADASRDRIYAGGTFTQINEQPRQGFAQFSGQPDITPPVVSNTNPDDGATGVPLGINLKADFSEEVDASTVTTSTFTLVRQGTPVPARVTYDPVADKATLNPRAALEPSVTYTATVKGGASGVEDLADNPMAADRTWSFTTTTDATAPAVQAPLQDFPSNGAPDASTVPVKISWSATDAESGVDRYEVQQSTNGGAYAAVSLRKTTTPNVILRLVPGSTYQFRVRAQDSAGNWSDWAERSAFLLRANQETSGLIRYDGNWTVQDTNSAYGGSLKHASAKPASALFTFDGGDVAWVATKGPDRGKAHVLIDGVKVATVNLYSATEKPRTMVFIKGDLNSSGTHTLEVQPLGTKDSRSSGTRVDVDAFTVLR